MGRRKAREQERRRGRKRGGEEEGAGSGKWIEAGIRLPRA